MKKARDKRIYTVCYLLCKKENEAKDIHEYLLICLSTVVLTCEPYQCYMFSKNKTKLNIVKNQALKWNTNGNKWFLAAKLITYPYRQN